MPPVPPLRTDRLRLVPLDRSAHAAALHDLYADPRFAEYLASGPVPTVAAKEETLAVFDELAPGQGAWVAVRHDDSTERVVGRFSLRPCRYAAPGDPLEVGWFVAVDQWGQGLAAEGIRAALSYAAGLGHRRVIALVRHDNARSRALAERLGGVVTGQGRWYGEEPSLRYDIELAGS
ncbi:MAG TPA: GNAT family protein [Dermatophilaceae bacterium]|nr:GNAT family protein [Dermatophilaceae bacterium]